MSVFRLAPAAAALLMATGLPVRAEQPQRNQVPAAAMAAKNSLDAPIAQLAKKAAEGCDVSRSVYGAASYEATMRAIYKDAIVLIAHHTHTPPAKIADDMVAQGLVGCAGMSFAAEGREDPIVNGVAERLPNGKLAISLPPPLPPDSPDAKWTPLRAPVKDKGSYSFALLYEASSLLTKPGDTSVYTQVSVPVQVVDYQGAGRSLSAYQVKDPRKGYSKVECQFEAMVVAREEGGEAKAELIVSRIDRDPASHGRQELAKSGYRSLGSGNSRSKLIQHRDASRRGIVNTPKRRPGQVLFSYIRKII